MIREATILADLHDARLDKAVRELFALTWNRARDMISRGKISVDGAVSTAPALAVSAGQRLVFDEEARAPARAGDITGEDIVHIDRYLLVVNKPAGILTVPFEQGDKGTLDQKVRSLLAARSKTPTKRRGALPPLMTVHRLDRGTSGLLVFARTFTAKEGLAQQLRDHSMEREYTAIVHGKARAMKIVSHFLEDRGDGIRGSRERSPNPKLRKSGKGRRAVTHVEPLRHLDGVTLLTCKLETGRTNQIRIHLSEEGHPLLGETTYMRGFKGPRVEAPRLMLHAGVLGFVHPITGEKLHFERPLPPDMTTIVDSLGK